MSLSKVILVTGGNRGIGFGIVQSLAQRSKENTIIIASRKRNDALQAAIEAKGLGYGNSFFPLELNVTLDESIRAAVDEVKSEFGRLDVLINNAGLGLLEDKEATVEWRSVWSRVLDTNITSPRLLTHAFLPLLEHSVSTARVINISSARGAFSRASVPTMPPTASIPYSVSKAAVNMLTLELGKAVPGVEFYAVSPGHCKTAFNGFRGTKEPVEGGRCAAELAVADEGAYDGGFWEWEEKGMQRVEW